MDPENTILKKSFELAVEGMKLSRTLQLNQKEYIASKQFMRSSTSVGAMVRESQQAESKADFIHKLSIALKEAKESEYWLELLVATGVSGKNEISKVESVLKENVAMLTSIIKTTKARNK